MTVTVTAATTTITTTQKSLEINANFEPTNKMNKYNDVSHVCSFADSNKKNGKLKKN